MGKVRVKKKKGGRPPKMLKRELRVTTRFSREEYSILQEKATKAGTNISELIRQSAIYGKVIARQSEEERNFTRQLIGMANNFNQMAKIAHREGTTAALRYFEQDLRLVNALLSKLQHGE